MISGISSYTDPYLTTLQQTGQAQGIASLLGGGNDPDGDGDLPGVGGPLGDSANISGPGKLFGQLQQLLSQDPAKFAQVASNIAAEIQSASQSATGNQSQFLSGLASKFQDAANTGDISSLLPHHHAHHAHGTYNQQGLAVPPSSPVNDPAASGGVDIRQLFANISNEVSAALGT